MSAPEKDDRRIGVSERACHVCGCTERNACEDPLSFGDPCHWVEPDLCSVCARSHGEAIRGTPEGAAASTVGAAPDLIVGEGRAS